MVKLTGPMSSFKASGTLANLLTYSNSRGRPYMKKKSNTPNRRSNRQLTFRVMFAWLAKEWAQIGPANRLLWEPEARLCKISAYNAYMAANTARWHNYLMPSQTPDAPAVLMPSTRNISVSSWDGEQFNISTNAAALLDGWGFIIHAGPQPNYDPTRSTAIIVDTDDTMAQRFFKWKPANPVSVRFRVAVFSKDGRLTQQPNGWNVNVP